MNWLTLSIAEGGWIMYVLIALHAVTWAVVLERLGTLTMARGRNQGVADAVAERLMRTGDAADSLRLQGLRRSAVGAVAYAGLLNANRSHGHIAQAMGMRRDAEVVTMKSIKNMANTKSAAN